jgi:magnesium transporter
MNPPEQDKPLLTDSHLSSDGESGLDPTHELASEVDPDTGEKMREGDAHALLDRVTSFLQKYHLAGEPESADDAPPIDPMQRALQGTALALWVNSLHEADIAYILEGLPTEERLYVWRLVESSRDGEILIEVSDAVRETLIRTMDSEELVAAAETLETDEIADLVEDLPKDVVQEIIEAQEPEERAELQQALSYEDGTVGALMEFEAVSIREDVSCEVALRYLRRFDELPSQMDAIYVVDRDDLLLGVLPLKTLLVNDPDKEVTEIFERDVVHFGPDDDANEAALAFERYDLVSAPVVDRHKKLIGRLTVDQVLDFVREREVAQQLSQAGLTEEEDIFASVWASWKNRWRWLAINLVTAFIASRVIGAFQGSIEKIVALATLMPIVAGIGGNSGNQTITMIVRAIAQGQVQISHGKALLRKEIAVSLINGLIWGGILGLITYWLYKDMRLGAVMTVAMTLNLMLAALLGVLIPMTMLKLDRDPALGSSVLITAITDSGGFFIFLGLATLLLPM